MTMLRDNQKTIISFLVAVFLLLPIIGTAEAQMTSPMGPGGPGDHGPPHHETGNDGTIWINTDIITIMANGEIPMFHFWFTDDVNGSLSKFSLTYLTMIEFEDSNGDDTFQRDEILFFAPLASYEWSVQTGSVEDDGMTTEVWIKYTKGGASQHGMHPMSPSVDMPGPEDINRFEDVTLQIWAHIYLQDYYGNVTDDHGVHANYTVAGGSELKMDIEIGNFPFSSENSSLALQTHLRENEALGEHEHSMHRWRTHERFGNVTGTSHMNWTSGSGNESRFQGIDDTHQQYIDFVNEGTNMATGFFSWVDQAVITLPGGATEAVNVTASYMPVGNGLAVTLAYPNFDGGSLLHDPSIGLYPEAEPLFEPPLNYVLFIGIGIIAVIAVVVAFKKRG